MMYINIYIAYTITSKMRNYLHRIARNPKSATKNPMVINHTCMLKVTVLHVCAKN